MKEFKRVSCPIKYGDCVLTEEFQKLQAEGWEVRKARYVDNDMEVIFFMEREVADNAV